VPESKHHFRFRQGTMTAAKIKSLRAREILDSRGNPAVEVEVTTESGSRAVASCPSGASTGKNEALELRDNDNKRFFGKGVLHAIDNVNTKISNMLAGIDCTNQSEIDKIMIESGGDEKLKFGANATTAVSVACAKVAARTKKIHLYQHISEMFGTKKIMSFPVLWMNIINGGKHSGNGLAIQEFMIQPISAAKSVKESIRMGSEIYHQLQNILITRLNKSSINVGDEGGFAPVLDYDELALSYISDAVTECGYSIGKDVVLGIDCAASNFWNSSKEEYSMGNKLVNSEELLNYYCNLVDKYPIKIIEDPFREDDAESFAKITEELGKKVSIIGDDIFVTNKSKVTEGVNRHIANGIIIKVNQVGTLTEAMEAARDAFSASWNVIASHRSGETNDDWLADFAVGIAANGIKAGAPARGERLAKYNRLMRIEELNHIQPVS
jgi:enolase